MSFPTMEEVEQYDVEQALRLTRFGKPRSDEELAVSNRNFERLGDLRRADPIAYTAASKGIGWGP